MGDIVNLVLKAMKPNHIPKDEVLCPKLSPEAVEPHLNSDLSSYKFLTLYTPPNSIPLKATRLMVPVCVWRGQGGGTLCALPLPGQELGYLADPSPITQFHTQNAD